LYKGQSPYLIDWAITAKCNLRCRHCRGMFQGDISSQRARKLVEEIAELRAEKEAIEAERKAIAEELNAIDARLKELEKKK